MPSNRSWELVLGSFRILIAFVLAIGLGCSGGSTSTSKDGSNSDATDVQTDSGGETQITPDATTDETSSADLTPSDSSTDSVETEDTTPPPPPPTFAIVIPTDAEPTAESQDLMGVNKPPYHFSKDGGQTFDSTALYQAFGIRQVRLHDSKIDPCEIYLDDTVSDLTTNPPTVLPHCTNEPQNGPPNVEWKANFFQGLDFVGNYDFGHTDTVIEKVQASGADVYLRLGESYNGPNNMASFEALAGWSRVARNLFLHVIGKFAVPCDCPETIDVNCPGENVAQCFDCDLHETAPFKCVDPANQTPYPGAITPVYIEVFNEPDGMFWVADNFNFYELYRQTVDMIRLVADEHGVQVRVGGSGFVHQVTETLPVEGSLTNGFVEAVTPARLDFFSAHYYGQCAEATLADAATWLQTLRGQLDELGLENLPLHITEWNIGLGKDCGSGLFGQPFVQSFVSGFLTILQHPDYKIQAAHYYAGIPNMSLFYTEDSQFFVRPSAWGFWAHSQLDGGSLVDASVCDDENCAFGYDATDSPLLVTASRNGSDYIAVVTNMTDSPMPYYARATGEDAANLNLSVHTPPAPDHPAHQLETVETEGTFHPTQDAVTDLLNTIDIETKELEASDSGHEAVVVIPAHSTQILMFSEQ
ncbi:MAG: hypothetical protein CMH54_10805 [Myxococcales bacterium]|nr:hypothetical protein [Myxococcales bacterium]